MADSTPLKCADPDSAANASGDAGEHGMVTVFVDVGVLRERVARQEAEISSLKAEKAKLEKDLGAALREMSRLRDEIIADLQRQLKERDDQIAELESELATVKVELRTANDRLSAVEEQLGKQADHIAELQEEQKRKKALVVAREVCSKIDDFVALKYPGTKVGDFNFRREGNESHYDEVQHYFDSVGIDDDVFDLCARAKQLGGDEFHGREFCGDMTLNEVRDLLVYFCQQVAPYRGEDAWDPRAIERMLKVFGGDREEFPLKRPEDGRRRRGKR